ncbi:MAG: hypothetical protein QXL22_06300 [Candidatus Nezhaarchaeales archaeon]
MSDETWVKVGKTQVNLIVYGESSLRDEVVENLDAYKFLEE